VDDRVRGPRPGGFVLTLSFQVGERFLAAAEEWADTRMMDTDEALEVKVEQALLEIEHLVADATEVEFTVEGTTVHHEPSDDLAAFLAAQTEDTGLDEQRLLKLHVDLFARAFLDDDSRPPNAPPT
jgi:transcriptional antiterminator Rof (Rho-off)